MKNKSTFMTLNDLVKWIYTRDNIESIVQGTGGNCAKYSDNEALELQCALLCEECSTRKPLYKEKQEYTHGLFYWFGKQCFASNLRKIYDQRRS